MQTITPVDQTYVPGTADPAAISDFKENVITCETRMSQDELDACLEEFKKMTLSDGAKLVNTKEGTYVIQELTIKQKPQETD